jgi:ketosteroid isomerase-like protein
LEIAAERDGGDHAWDCVSDGSRRWGAGACFCAEGRDRSSEWIEFFNKGDFADIASLYTTDAAAFPPGSPMVRGRDAIAAMWKKLTDPRSPLSTSRRSARAAREIGTFRLETKGPTPQEVTGKYVVVWEKVGNDWQLAADIWNDGK